MFSQSPFSNSSRSGRPDDRRRRRRIGGAWLLALASCATVAGPFGSTPSVSAAPVGATQAGGPVILDGTDSGLHGSIMLDGSGVPKASELRSTWVYELKAWETLLAGVPSSYAHNGKVAIVGATDSTATGNNCGAAAHYIAERLASGSVTVDYFDGQTQISTLFDGVLAGTTNYHMIQIVEQGWCNNGLDSTEAATVNSRGPAIAAHVNRGGALFAQSQSYGWLNSLFTDLAASTAGCSGSTPELTAAGYAQFPDLTNADIAAPWHNCFTATGEFPLTQLALQSGTHTVILGGDSVTLPSTVSLSTSPEQPRPGDTVCTTATVVSGGVPVEGASVEFFVDGESVGTEVTNADGEAVYCYTVADSGEEEVKATVTTGPGTGTDTTTVTTSTLSLEAAPSSTLPRGDSVCIDVLVATTDGVDETPASGAAIDFDVDGANGPTTGSDLTDASGAAQFCYTGANGGQDIVTATITSGAPADSRAIIVNWSGARVDVVDVSQNANGTGKVVPVTVDEFTDGTVYATVSIPAGAGTLSLNTSGYAVALTAPTPSFTNQSTLAFEGSLSNISGLLSSRLTWNAPADAGSSTITVTVADDLASPTESATGTGTLSVTAPPVITKQPESLTVDAGATFMLHAHSSGVPTPVAQWQVSTDGGDTWTNFSGGEEGHLMLMATNEMDGNHYRARISNSIGNVTSEVAVVTVNVAVAPVFTDDAVANLVVGTPLADAVAASGTPAPTYSVTAGSLPAGLTLDPATGAITGTPTATGPYSFTIEAANTAGTVSTVISGVVEAAPVDSDEPPLGGFTVGVPFTGSVEIDGEPAPTYSVTDGELPDGLTLDPVTGAITGTPTTAGDYSFSITAVNEHGSVTMTFTGTISAIDDGTVDPPVDDNGPLLVRLDPARLVDTRTTDRLDAGDVLRVPVAGIAGVPEDAESVALNVTVVDPAEEGFVTVYPCGEDVPLASNVNFAMGEVVANAVTATVGDDGAVCVYTLTDVDVVVDLNGAYSANEGTDGLMPLGPTRVLDTRIESAKPTAGSVQRIELRDLDGVPADATAAMLNVTVTEPEALGFVTVYPCTDDVPTVSSVNYVAGQTVPNAVLAPFDADGAVCLFTLAAAHIVVDVNGAFSPSEVDGTVRALAPTRLVDTRTTGTPLTGNEPFELRVTGRGGVHADATGVIVNVTVTEPAAIGFVTVHRCGEPTPVASNLNFVAGETVANAVLAPVDADGDICIVSLVDTHLVVDVNAARQK